MSALREALHDLPDAVFADLLESDDAYLVVLDLPGAATGTVDLSVSSGTLHIEARREKDVPSEFRYVTEERALFLDVELPIPTDASGSAAEASLDRGVLDVQLPKQTSNATTTIPIEER